MTKKRYLVLFAVSLLIWIILAFAPIIPVTRYTGDLVRYEYTEYWSFLEIITNNHQNTLAEGYIIDFNLVIIYFILLPSIYLCILLGNKYFFKNKSNFSPKE
jgi:hypothetical protein